MIEVADDLRLEWEQQGVEWQALADLRKMLAWPTTVREYDGGILGFVSEHPSTETPWEVWLAVRDGAPPLVLHVRPARAGWQDER